MPHARIGPVTDAARLGAGHHGAMTTNGRHHRRPSDEERAFFEAIVGLRARYATRGADDAAPVIGLHHAIASANAALSGVQSSPTLRLGIAGN